MPTIGELNPTILQSRDYLLASENNGLNAKLTVAQVLGLLTMADLDAAFGADLSAGIDAKLDATVWATLGAKATPIAADLWAIRDSVSGLMKKVTTTQLLAMFAGSYPRFDIASVLTEAQQKVFGGNIGHKVIRRPRQNVPPGSPVVAVQWLNLSGASELLLTGTCQAAVNGAAIGFQVSFDNGVTWQAGAVSYAMINVTSNALTQAHLMKTTESASNSYAMGFETLFHNIAGTLPATTATGFSRCKAVTTGGQNFMTSLAHSTTAGTVNAIRALMSTGNIIWGDFDLEVRY